MPQGRQIVDYEPVTRSRRTPLLESATDEEWLPRVRQEAAENDEESRTPSPSVSRTSSVTERHTAALKRGHAISFAGLFLYTVFVYFRPYELIPALSFLENGAYWIAVFTLLVFLPTQLGLEGNLTIRTPEVNFLLLLTLTAVLSIPLAISTGEAWATLSGVFIKIVIMFVVMVNVVRTRGRLNSLLLLTLAVSCVMSVSAFNDYRTGNFTVEGYRVTGKGNNMFGNADDMALHLVTMVPIAIALLLETRSLLKKIVLSACALLLITGTVLTFSRGGFLGLVAAATVLAWKLGRRNRVVVVVLLLFFGAAFMLLAPGNYGLRVLSIFNHSLDQMGSADARRVLLWRSLYVAFTHPLLGVGMGNFHIVSLHDLVSHNAYTQVAAEMGIPALACYVMLMITPIRRLRRMEHETYATRRGSRFYHLSVGLQAALVAYMVSSFFLSVAYSWYVYYLVGYAVCLWRMYEATKTVASDEQEEVLSAED